MRVAEERVWLYISLSWIDTGYPARHLLDTSLGLNLSESCGFDWGVGAWSATLGNACDFVPLPRLSRFYHRRGLALAEQAPEQGASRTQYGLTVAHFHAGLHDYVATGDWASAHSHLGQGRDEMLRLGRIRDWGAATSQLAAVLFDQGEWTEAQALCREVIALSEETGDHVAEAWGRTGAGAGVLLAQGEFEDAEAYFVAAAAALFAARDVASGAMAGAWIAFCRLKQGRLGEARALLSEGIDRVRKNGIRGHFVRHVWIAHAAVSLAMAEQADDPARTSALKEAKAAADCSSRTAGST